MLLEHDYLGLLLFLFLYTYTGIRVPGITWQNIKFTRICTSSQRGVASPLMWILEVLVLDGAFLSHFSSPPRTFLHVFGSPHSHSPSPPMSVSAYTNALMSSVSPVISFQPGPLFPWLTPLLSVRMSLPALNLVYRLLVAPGILCFPCLGPEGLTCR